MGGYDFEVRFCSASLCRNGSCMRVSARIFLCEFLNNDLFDLFDFSVRCEFRWYNDFMSFVWMEKSSWKSFDSFEC